MKSRRSFITSCSVALVFGMLLAPFTFPHAATTTETPGRAQPRASAPAAVERALPSTPRVRASEPAARKPAPPPTTMAKTDDRLALFRGLGAWIDIYDLNRNVARDIEMMRAGGVRTLYIQTGRSNTRTAIDPRVGRWLVAAHEAGIKVVGWYLPYYRQPWRDAARTYAIKTYSYAGHRFDGLGIDIEFQGVRGGTWNRNVVDVSRRVRRAVGPYYPVAAIPPTPLQMRVAPRTWAGFPWHAVSVHSDAILLMSYWTERRGCPAKPIFCAYDFTAENVRLTRALVRPGIIVHVIGGVGDRMSDVALAAFIRGAQHSDADGASLYDVATTDPRWWRTLWMLRSLGDR